MAKSSKEADMYAFGVVIYGVVTGPHPPEQDWSAWNSPPITSTRPDRPKDPVAIGFGQGTWEFTEQCWDSWQRPTAREALEHFEHAAKTSMVVDPGPTMPTHGMVGELPSRLDPDSGGHCECNGASSIFPL